MMLRTVFGLCLSLACFVVVPAIAAERDVTTAESESTSDFVELFNGKNLDGWVVDGASTYKKDGEAVPVWTVADGAIQCAGKGYGFLRYDKPFSDFQLRLEFKLAPKCNSGVGIRHAKYVGSKASRPSFSGYEIQLLDDADVEPNEHSTGSLYRYQAAQASAIKPAGEWNEMIIECRGPRIKITLNGKVVQDVDQSTIPVIAKKPLEGYVSVQNHGGQVSFRRIAIRDLSGN